MTTTTSPGTADEPAAPLVDPRKLTDYAGGQLPGEGELHVERLAEGHSNLTFTVTRGGTDTAWILRRPPRGPLLPTAHDVIREANVLRLLASSTATVRIPTVAVSCEDPGVLGVPFYLMERTDGVVIRDRLPDWLGEAERRTAALDLIDALVELHAAPVEPFVEARLGRPTGYIERQIRRWNGQRDGIKDAVEAAGGKARELPDYDAVKVWLREEFPSLAEQTPSIVHGDYKLDNVILDPETSTVAAIVDWEMATVGDPLADLGYLMSFWPDDTDDIPSSLGGAVVGAPGFPRRAELAERYAEKSGRTLSNIRFYEVLAIWKLAILLEASYHRFLAGTTDDPFFAMLEDGVPQLFARARALTGV